MTDQTDLDLITDHPFEAMTLVPEICGYLGDQAWPCGWGEEEHTQNG